MPKTPPGKLVCPACRWLDVAGAIQALEEHPAGHACARCGRVYPVVDDTPLVLADLDGWLQHEGVAVIARTNLPAPVYDRLVRGIGGPLGYQEQWRAIYESSREGPLQDWVRRQAAELTGRVLDLGCGIGVHERTDVLGLDVHWSVLRHYAGPRLLADALQPPFPSGAFDAILAVNIVDSCRDPRLLMQRIDDLLAPGGNLVLTCAFAWQDAITPPERRLPEAQLVGALQASGYELGSWELEWPLHLSARTRTVHRAVCLRGRKPA